ncbi:sulfotransferase domain-containing protein [Glycomyces tritici]|uniref:Sulfotransferase domain-containing protein n=1 Tax=Glycomyces tritici TaxID=2665176 RepID=A0ABT7YPQ4_9ACTN|nr:sulfotransferase domain-containing protein [Glycomyces tritici]MDN3239081.1 sulfotransferase domain-containing protein [Glycomyces tritici]MDN3240243.1 sulfotransferase domain-containing protein [Glycomyces tritici]
MEDSHRWLGFPARDGDIVISTRSKHGTTWTQMICALLAFQTPELPAPLSELSPWLDWTIAPADEVFARLEAQRHRRIIKTHTPLDGIPIRPETRYIVVARHPLDAAVSLYHQGDNIIRERVAELTGEPVPEARSGPRPELRDWLAGWTRSHHDPREAPDMLPGVMAHLADAWARRDAPNLLLVHYADLAADLDGEMRRIAAWLDIEVDESRWPELVKAATFGEMKAKAAHTAPDPAGLFRSRDAFFRNGTSGSGAALLGDEALAAYTARVAQMAPKELLDWLHRP